MATVLYDKIVTKLRDKQKQITVPVRLPIERTMAKDFNVGRDTVRRALEELEKGGHVTRKRGLGTFLHPAGGNYVGDLRGCHVGFVPPWWADSTSSWFTSTVFDGVARWADEHECQISVLHADRHSKNELDWMKKLGDRDIAGIIWVHPASEQLPLIEHTAKRLPSIVLGRCYPGRGLHHVMPDYNKAAQLIDDHLVSNGHTTYTTIGASVLASYSQSWIKAFDKAFARRGSWFDRKQDFIDIKPFIREKLADLLLDFYAPIHPDVHAYVLTSSSYMTALVSNEQFRQRMMKDISVIAFDFGLYPMDAYWPGHKITHVRCDWPKIGRRAMSALALLVEEKEVPEVILEPVEFRPGQTVHTRKSTGGKQSEELDSKEKK